MVEDVLVGSEDVVRKPRMNCQMFSTGFSSGDLAGTGTSVMFGRIGSVFETCQPARSRTRMACAPGATDNAAFGHLNLKLSRLNWSTDWQPISFMSRSISARRFS